MIFDVCEKVKVKFAQEKIRLEYSSLLNQTNQFILRQENDDFAIIVPRKLNISEIEAIWSLAHEYGHYLIRNNKDIDEYYMSRLEIERLSWEKGKLFLKELNLPITEGQNTYDSFAEINLDTYKTDIQNYKNKKFKKEKLQDALNMFSVLSSSFANITNGLILAYILLTTINLEGKIATFLNVAIVINIISLVLRYAVRWGNKDERL